MPVDGTAGMWPSKQPGSASADVVGHTTPSTPRRNDLPSMSDGGSLPSLGSEIANGPLSRWAATMMARAK
jgi:hypothetical protein